MRIDFVITELFPGGAERCLTELAIGFTGRGDQVRVFSIGKLPTSSSQLLLVNRLVDAGISVETADSQTWRQFLSASRKLKKWLQEDPPNICQSFLHHGNVLAGVNCNRLQIPHLAGIRVAEPNSLRCTLERLTIRSARQIVCVSHQVNEFACQRLGGTGRTVTIPNGVDAAVFESAAPFDWETIGLPSDAQVTLFVGRLHEQKGIELLQKKIETIAPAESNRFLVLVGDGPLAGDIERWAADVRGAKVKRLGWCRNVASLMRASQLLVLPSHFEGMPNVVLEAMASGLPVVCSQVEGSQELLANHPADQGFAVGDENEMAARIENFYQHPDRARNVGLTNQSYVKANFSIQSMIDQYQTCYQQFAR